MFLYLLLCSKTCCILWDSVFGKLPVKVWVAWRWLSWGALFHFLVRVWKGSHLKPNVTAREIFFSSLLCLCVFSPSKLTSFGFLSTPVPALCTWAQVGCSLESPERNDVVLNYYTCVFNTWENSAVVSFFFLKSLFAHKTIMVMPWERQRRCC